MNKYYYDLHVHSALSPCGDGDMTPQNIAGMAAIKGLRIVALTDHNTTKNCPAFFAACRMHGIIPVPGMELTTAEDIHLVCLFDTLDGAMSFDAQVERYKIKIKNRPDIFGSQQIFDENDNVIGEIEELLLNATMLSLDEGTKLCREFGGVCYPAHIDRASNGVVAILGAFPDWLDYTAFEVSGAGNEAEERAKHKVLERLVSVKSSDAHYLWDISEAENFFLLDDSEYSSEIIRKKLLGVLRGEVQ